MAAAETRLGKPLLLEEFGKRLPPGELEAGAIAKQRDPVFETSFAAVAKSIAMCAVALLLWVLDCGGMGVNCHLTKTYIQTLVQAVINLKSFAERWSWARQGLGAARNAVLTPAETPTLLKMRLQLENPC